MYRDLGFVGYPYVEDLPKEVAFRDKHYKISILKTYTGGLCSADSSDGIFYVLRDSLDLCFTARRHAMMVCKDNAIAMFKDNFGYYILDSHARSPQGLMDPNGTAVLLMFKTLTDLHKGILRLFNSISSVHCETAYSLTEVEIYIDSEQWNIGHSSLVRLYLEKQAKMKEQKINKDKKGQKEKSEKNLTAAAMRKRKSRQNSNYRATEQESDTARRKKKREDSTIRAKEQECDTLRRKTKRKNPAIAATEKEYNTAKRKEMREDPAISAAEQECDTLRRKTKREDPAIAATEKEYNTAKRKEMREDPAIRAAEQECDTLRKKKKRENPAIAATEKEYNTAKRREMREDPAIAAAEKEYNTAKRKEMREDPAIRAAEQECDTLRKKKKRENPAIAATEKEYNTAKRREMREDPAIAAAEKNTIQQKEKKWEKIQTLGQQSKNVILWEERQREKIQPLRQQRKNTIQQKEGKWEKIQPLRQQRKNTIHQGRKMYVEPSDFPNLLQEGYRISGHLLKMAAYSYVSVVIDVALIPILFNIVSSSLQVLKKIIPICWKNMFNQFQSLIVFKESSIYATLARTIWKEGKCRQCQQEMALISWIWKIAMEISLKCLNWKLLWLQRTFSSWKCLIFPNPDGLLWKIKQSMFLFKTLTDLHKGILRLFNSISSVHCETAYSLTEVEIYIDSEQWNIGHSSLVRLYLEKQAKMKEQKINKDKKGQKEKSEKNLTAAAMRKRKSRQNSNYRATEQESDTARRKKKREDSTIRAKEQECDTLRRKTKRKNPAIAATEKEYNTAKRKEMREDPAISAAEQECDTLRRKTKREDPAIAATEKEYNTAKRKEMREDPAIRAAEQECDTLRKKKKRENPAIAATEKEYNTAKRREMREDPAIAAAEKEYNTAKRKEMREDPAIRAAEQECDTLRKKKKRENPAIAATEKEYNTAKRREMREDPAIAAAEKNTIQQKEKKWEKIQTLGQQSKNVILWEERQREKIQPLRQQRKNTIQQKEGKWEKIQPLRQQRKNTIHQGRKMYVEPSDFPNLLQEGYRISGHLLKMAAYSYVSVVIDVALIPILFNIVSSSLQVLKKIIPICWKNMFNQFQSLIVFKESSIYATLARTIWKEGKCRQCQQEMALISWIWKIAMEISLKCLNWKLLWLQRTFSSWKCLIFPNPDGLLWKIKQSMFLFKMMLCCKQSVVFHGCPLKQESSLWNWRGKPHTSNTIYSSTSGLMFYEKL